MMDSTSSPLKIVGTYALHIIYFLLFIIVLSVPDIVGEVVNALNVSNPDLITLLGQSLLSTLIILFLYNRYKKQLTSNSSIKYGATKLDKNKVIFIIIMIVMFQVMDFIFNNLLNIGTPENQQLIETMFKTLPMSMAVSTVIVAPIAEELIFRGIFFNYFFPENSTISTILRVLASALVFGLVHEAAPTLSLLYYSSLGLILAATYAYTKDIRYNIFLHILNNAIAVIAIFNG